MKSSSSNKIMQIFQKEIKCALRNKSSFLTCLMFGVTVIACVSFALQGNVLEAKMQASIFWIALFFTFMSCGEGIFADEVKAGTILALRIYGDGQSVLWGKMLYNAVFLSVMAVVLAPLYIMFMDCDINNLFLFALVLIAGAIGVASSGTLVASLSVSANSGKGIFAILMLPVILPVLLLSVLLTSQLMGAGDFEMQYLGTVIFYDVISAVGASVLFDYVW
ncbi:MAG: heme exporter protein CcmB [Selenomonadaceae bacterium]|nr:heme exporter protein CcmB [Selenomonadaceae bacterium]